MEFVGQPRASEACSLLGVPGLSSVDVDDDECEVVIGIRPKSSPLPRRRSSENIEDSEPEPPLSGSRRVSFADAKGLSLVQVKKFDTWDIPKLPGCDSSEGEGKDEEKYFISPLTFSLPLSTEELYVKVREQKVELETIELLPGTTILRGVIRVLNVSFNKAVYVRTSLNTWSSHFDLLAEYMPGSNDSLMDLFSFKLTLVPPFAEQGARVDFCLRYETPVGTFWANNNDRNYVLYCRQRAKERKGTPQNENMNKKSCLKTISQNFSTVESISSMEASSKENISTEVSKHGEEVDTVKTKQISDGQSGTSEEMKQRLLAESRRNCSRRNRRKAARMTRLKDYFSQKSGGADDTERDKSPPETKQAAKEGSPEEKHSEVRSFPDGSGKSDGSESLETRSEPLLEHDTSPAHDSSETEKSESIHLALTGAESATDIWDSPSSDEPAPAEYQDINKFVSKAEEPADSVLSAAISESLVSQTNSLTFGTVVAPLYHQVSGRVGSESQSGGEWGNPALSVGDVTLSYPHAERRHRSCTNVRSNDHKVQESLDATLKSPPMVDEETSLTANNIQDLVETLQDPVDICSDKSSTNASDRDVHPNILNTDLLNPQILSESLHPQGKAQEDSLTYDLQLPEHTYTLTNQDETLSQSKTQEVKTSMETSFMLHTEKVSGETHQQTSVRGANNYKSVHESNKDNDNCKTTSITNEDQLLEALQDLNPNHINNSVTKETEKNYGSCFEMVEEKDVITPQILESNNVEEGKNLHKDESKYSTEIKVTGEVGDSTTQAAISDHVHGDTRKIEHEMQAAVSKKEDFCLANTTEVNWEKMVEEEEKSILTDEGESEAVSLKTAEEDHKLLEDTGIETASENRDASEAEKQETEDENRIKGEEIGLIVAGKDREEAEEESDCVQAAETAGEEKTEEQEETELEKEKHFSEMQEVKEEDIKEMEIDLNSDDEADMQWEDQVKTREENAEEENPNDEEEILVDETGEAEIVDTESESMTIEDRENESGCFEERLDIAPNVVEDGLSASVNNVQDKSVSYAHIPTEMHLYKEEDFQKNLTHDLSNAERDENDSVAAEGSLSIFTDEPESDDSAASGDYDSDDEVELYMHCLRAVHTGEQAQKDRNKDTGFSVGRRPSVSRSKLLSSPMPSISESVDEEQHFSGLQDNHEDIETADFQPTAAALPASSGQESINVNAAWWKETFSFSNIAKTLLCATLLVVFLVVAYRYDFIACFGLYLISVVWLYYHGDKKPEQQKQQQNRLN